MQMYQTRLIVLTIAFTLLSMSTSYGQSTSEAVAYMDGITLEYKELKTETWQYLKSIMKGKNARKVENRRQDLVVAMRTAKAAVSRKRPFQQDATFKEAMINYMDINLKLLNEDFEEIVDMEEIAEQSYDNMEAYLLAKEKANEKFDEASDLVNEAQKTFAAKHNITILEAEGDKTTNRIEKASKVLSYYNDLYLIFFKSYKQDMYVLAAMEEGNVLGIEQNMGTLALFSEEGIASLEEIEAFDGDKSLVTSTQTFLTYMKKQADEYYPKFVDFYLKKDNMEKIKKIVESKSKKERTKEDIDKYNKAVKDFNAAVADYNDVINTSNKERSKAINEWNKMADGFFSKHSKG